MTMSELQFPIWARLNVRRFDVMFVVGLAMAAIPILAIFILVSRESCEEERIVGLAYYMLLWSGMATMFGSPNANPLLLTIRQWVSTWGSFASSVDWWKGRRNGSGAFTRRLAAVPHAVACNRMRRV